MPGPLGSLPTAARHRPPFGSPCRRLRFPLSPGGQASTLVLAPMWHQPSGARTMLPRSLAAPVDLAEAAAANRKPASVSHHACAPPSPPQPPAAASPPLSAPSLHPSEPVVLSDLRKPPGDLHT